MVKSMTGFGRSNKQLEDFNVSVEIKAVNHRFREQTIRMPKQFLNIEEKIKKTISNDIHRGRVEVFIMVEGDRFKNQKVIVDYKSLDHYHQLLTEIKNRYSIQEPISIDDLLKKEDCFQLVDEEVNENEVEQIILDVVEEAIIELTKMRTAEGIALQHDILHLLGKAEQTITRLHQLAPQVITAYREKIKARIEDYLQDKVEETRLLTEVAIFADKADINEELIRLKSHIQQFHHILQANEAIGRKLDFLLQEMNREVNTIGSKANSADISKEVVEMKSFLEKIKEQIQNIE
ncbi:YicC/YloC family endoribonuclease [Niallia sp. 01092]|uniref:YicC/YloC family endoribonuclease n=1 Tax=unclassified Niallia TaxID=2837522 RepID=UPI003FD6820B